MQPRAGCHIQVEITGSGKISSTGFNPQQGFFEVPGIYMLGDGEVRLEGNSSGNKELKNEFMSTRRKAKSISAATPAATR